MLRHLVLDLFRRLWPVYAGTTAILALLWALAGALDIERGFFFALSMAATFVLGPLIALTQISPTEILLLPLPRREIWRATWCVGTVSAGGATLIAKLAGVAAAPVFSSTGPLGVSQAVISSLIDVAYAGTLLGGLLLLRAGTGSRGPIGRVVSAVAITLTVVTFAGGVLWGFLLQSYLPIEWEQLTGPAASLLAAGIGVALAAYFHMPPPGIRVLNRRVEARSHRVTIAHYGALLARLTGSRLMLVHETLVTACGTFTMIVVVAVLGTFIDPQAGLAETLRAWRLLPFASGDPTAAIFSLVIYGSVMLNAFAPGRDPGGSSPWRQLRVLPMTTAGLVRLLLVRRGTGWLTIWTALLILHVSVTRSLPATLRPELFVLAVGADALIYAVQVRWQQHPISLAYLAVYGAMMLVFGLVLVLPLRVLSETWADTLLLPLGLGALVAAAWILRRTLQYSSKLYAPAPKVAPAGLL
jgi:hypothetical protein